MEVARLHLARLAVVLAVVLLAVPLALVRESSAAPISGIVNRPAVAQAKPLEVSRYRGRDAAVTTTENEEPAAACGCNPGDFAVVHLTGEKMPALRPLPAPPSMAQKNRAFVPAVLAVPVGATVEFPNLDPFFHNVFSYSKIRKFDLGRYPQGEKESVQFDRPGLVSIFCEIHYSMRAYVHVFDTPYFAVSDESGRFDLGDVDPGEYVLHVWQENQAEIAVHLVVADEPLHVEVP
jgi:hypothetical protein